MFKQCIIIIIIITITIIINIIILLLSFQFEEKTDVADTMYPHPLYQSI